MSSLDNLHIVGMFDAPPQIVDIWPVGCCFVYDGTVAGTMTSRCWFYLKLEGGKGMLISFSSLFFCCWPIIAEG